jgi:hypothetical protein
MPISLEIAGINGTKINRLIKERKKRVARKIMVPITDRRGSGLGHVLLLMETPLIRDIQLHFIYDINIIRLRLIYFC